MDETVIRPDWATLPPLDAAESKTLAEAIAYVLDEKKGHEIKMLFVEAKTILADSFVICTGNSNTQVKALGDEVELIDFGTVIVHIFDRAARDFYNLDKLWSDAVPVEHE